MNDKPSPGAIRAAEKYIGGRPEQIDIDFLAQIIDKETGLKELIEALKLFMELNK